MAALHLLPCAGRRCASMGTNAGVMVGGNHSGSLWSGTAILRDNRAWHGGTPNLRGPQKLSWGPGCAKCAGPFSGLVSLCKLNNKQMNRQGMAEEAEGGRDGRAEETGGANV